jgi:hypothetical protein
VAPFFLMLGGLGSYFWAQVAGLHLFDAGTLLLFRKTHPTANRTDSIWRLARVQQGLGLALTALALVLVLVTLHELASIADLAVPMLLLLNIGAAGARAGCTASPDLDRGGVDHAVPLRTNRVTPVTVLISPDCGWLPIAMVSPEIVTEPPK